MSSNERNPWKGLLLGMAGGIAGVLAMRLYWQQVQQITGHDPRKDFEQSDVPDSDVLDSVSLVGKRYRQGESSTAPVSSPSGG